MGILIIRSIDKLLNKLKKNFGYQEINQLFIKYSEGNLNAAEQNKLDDWVTESDNRKRLFIKLKEIIEFQNKMSLADPDDLHSILQDLKKSFPEVYAEMPDNTFHFVLEKTLKFTLDQLNYGLTQKIVYANWWVSIVAFIVRLTLIILIIIFIVLISKAR